MASFVVPTLPELPQLSFGDSVLFDVFCALAVHRIYNKYEPEPGNMPVTLLLLAGVPAMPSYFLTRHVQPAMLAIILSYALFYVTLALSIVVYRISPLHPLAKYPGPLWLKISKFAAVYQALGGKQYTYFKRLHEKYGPFVRVGPNELSIADAEAITSVLGIDGMRRGPLWIAHVRPGTPPNVLALRDVERHHERRKLWNHGFTTSSIKELQPIVEERVLELVEELGKRAAPKVGENEPVDLAQWLANFTYDFMGDLVFGGGINMMRNSDERRIRMLLERALRILGLIEHVSWVVSLMGKLLDTPEDRKNYERFGTERYDLRKKNGSARRDLFHYITNEEGLEKVEVPRDQGLNEIFAAIVAGADTTSTVLSGLFFHLLSNPDALGRLRKEVDSEFPLGEGEPFDAVKLAGMPYLNAVINEGLRLQPPLATSLQRSPLKGSGGKMVADRFVPESAAIYIPPYVLHRDPRYFSPSPNSFIPERWLDNGSKEFKISTAAYIPFSYGPANCVGKNLALLEMRMVVSSIVQKFDLRLADGYDTRKWEEQLQDYFVMKVGELPVVLHSRA